jgi:hypothetical protein
MIALKITIAPLQRRPMPAKRELYRERCQDEFGNHYIVIVWRDWPGLPIPTYTLKDGTPVRYEDDCYFTVVPTRKRLTRCD